MKTNEEKRERNRLYYIKNKERIKLKYDKDKKAEYNKKYHSENSENLKSYCKSYYHNNNEKQKKKAINYYELNKENYKKKNKEYREKNIESIKAQQKKWNDANKDKLKNNRYVKKYDITLEQYEELLYNQKNKCKICGTHENELNYKLVVDHCHDNGIVRGLLCSKCNSMLGFVKDNVEVLENAIKYLLNCNK